MLVLASSQPLVGIPIFTPCFSSNKSGSAALKDFVDFYQNRECEPNLITLAEEAFEVSQGLQKEAVRQVVWIE